MDATELKATIARVDKMRERCQALIKDKPLQLDRTVGRKRITRCTPEGRDRPQSVGTGRHIPPVGSGPLAGREMRRSSGYSPKISRGDMQDGSIDAIFADFEAAFDEMAQAHRA